jgi:hypothetical protein
MPPVFGPGAPPRLTFMITRRGCAARGMTLGTIKMTAATTRCAASEIAAVFFKPPGSCFRLCRMSLTTASIF